MFEALRMLLGFAVLKTGGFMVQAGAVLVGAPTAPRGAVEEEDDEEDDESRIGLQMRVELSEEAKRMVAEGRQAPPTVDHPQPQAALSGSLADRMARARAGG